MKQPVVVYTIDGVVYVMHPSPEALEHYTVKEIAEKDVPEGVPFAIAEYDDLPWHVPQEAWVVDEADCTDGCGGESNLFVRGPYAASED